MTETDSGTAAPEGSLAVTPGRLVAGQYRLLRELGRGGMGVVWLAEDELLARRVAVKELRPPRGLTDASLAAHRERALREARSGAKVKHPGAVTLHSVIADGDDSIYLIMEFVDGPTLAELIAQHGAMPAPWVRAIGLRLLDVLQAAHALGIVHRDVKPGNIMITRDGQAKLTDFGIAYSLGELRLTSDGVMGTRSYLAPELCEDGPITPAADLWALGATLYHAAEGRAPFDRDSTAATLRAILLDPPPVPDCEAGLAAAIGAMLHRDPAKRATIEEARALLQQGTPRPASAEPPELPRPPTADAGTVLPAPVAAVVPADGDPGGSHLDTVASGTAAASPAGDSLAVAGWPSWPRGSWWWQARPQPSPRPARSAARRRATRAGRHTAAPLLPGRFLTPRPALLHRRPRP
jgi:serine/threonine protein kinase